MKIKFEIDINSPLKFQTEAKKKLIPIIFDVLSMTLYNLYARKMHAVLCRNWKIRVMCRDWFDFEWYVKCNTKLNLEHLQERMYESCHLDQDTKLDNKLFIQKMNDKIDTLNIDKVNEEISPFIKDNSVFYFGGKDYFRLLTKKVLLL